MESKKYVQKCTITRLLDNVMLSQKRYSMYFLRTHLCEYHTNVIRISPFYNLSGKYINPYRYYNEEMIMIM